MHAYIYAIRRKNKKDRRLAIEQQCVRRCAFRGLDEISFRRKFTYIYYSQMPRIFSLYFTSFAYLNFWIYE